MPDKRQHRGAHPADGRLFGPSMLDRLRNAMADYCLLLGRGYAEKSALKLVGDHFDLTARQRLAIMRSACSDRQLKNRIAKQVDLAECRDETLLIDGYNLLIMIESAISGGFLFKGRDGCLRDIAGIHGTYRKVNETIPALELIGRFLNKHGINNIQWLLDKPVSNSGRLRKMMLELAEDQNSLWQVELTNSPDKMLTESDRIVVTSDSVVLDQCKRWVNLASEIVTAAVTDAKIVDLSGQIS